LRELSLHLLDIAENSISAGADAVHVEVEEDTQDDRLRILVRDNGCGMDGDLLARVVDPFVTSRTTRKVGLGIPLLKAAAEMCAGTLTINSELGKGTQIEAIFQRSHIDRMPIGNLPDTLLTLLIGSPEIHWTFHYRFDDRTFEFDDEEIKATLDGVPLSEPAVISFLRGYIAEGITAALQGSA
jgi:anti-sigma regulatory factor (Ser/Thr protein kinase)